jgi:hypothetical protein
MLLRLKYLYRDKSRHGQERIYASRPGKPKIRIFLDPGDDNFVVAYLSALGGGGPMQMEQ